MASRKISFNHEYFHFMDGHLYYGDDDLSLAFEPRVVEVQKHIDANGQAIGFFLTIGAFDVNGILISNSKQTISDLGSISYRSFGAYSEPDKYSKSLLLQKMEREALQLPVTSKMLLSSGLSIYEGKPVFVLFDSIISQNTIPESLMVNPGKRLLHLAEDLPEFHLSDIRAYIDLWPEVTVLLFYASLFGILKPFIRKTEIHSCLPDFVFGVFGPSGHLKTTLTKRYALLSDTPEDEMFTLSGRSSLYDRIISALKSGHHVNVLLDDMRPRASRSGSNNLSDLIDEIIREQSRALSQVTFFITGENSRAISLFSELDRIFKIEIPEQSNEQIRNLKAKINYLGRGTMSAVIVYFLRVLLSQYDDVIKDIVTEYNRIRSSIMDDLKAPLFPTRIDSYATFLYLTESIFCKYVCDNDKTMSGYIPLKEAITHQINLQIKELAFLHIKDSASGYVPYIAEILSPTCGILERFEVCHGSSIYQGKNFSDAEHAYMVDNKYYYVKVETLKYALRCYFDRIPDWKTVKRNLIETGAARYYETSGGIDITSQYNSKIKRIIFLPRDTLESFLPK